MKSAVFPEKFKVVEGEKSNRANKFQSEEPGLRVVDGIPLRKV